MTPSEIETAARNKYNSTGDSFWSSNEIYGLIYEAELEMARDAINIENIYSTSTVIGQQTYSVPDNCISIKRIEYNGAKIERITLREDDSITNLQSDITTSGEPIYYFEWNGLIYLRPLPSAVGTLRIFTYDKPTEVTTASQTIEIPAQFHRDLVNFVVREMALKDQNGNTANFYAALWQNALKQAKAWNKKRKRGDEFQVVKNMDDMAKSVLGTV
jgi:hypothetical protein